MARVTDYACVNENGYPVLADTWGNNVAFRCESCGSPVLADLHDSNQRGAKPENPSVCRACGSRYWVEPEAQSQRLTLHRVLM